MTNSLLTVSEASEILRVSTRTVRRWIAWGILPGIRVTRRTIRIRKADIDNFLNADNSKKESMPKEL